ncbi:MAG: hypothetical protein HBSAPP02_31080 [Phycisphaerae bacterium]|nr:MAG: hypothetical protein HBSAPP02_31080 [Phycisphaerae bacterium]
MIRKLFAATVLSAATIFLVAACSQNDGSCCGHCGNKGNARADRPPLSTTEVVYVCSMHPEVRQAAPGNCPKCGMELKRQ